ncbi:hypothetical protein B0H17DRAFT_1152868 [Mycena rosella]|uniref:Uncharacterized protein n=1 Tax=Mycena rosella TaxID=1033263 RepID=A0AAD7BAS8_MYCRO|nr:hypothetical protein B0H17DRAFT_1152868 [Mycena rosella]
MVSTRSNHAPSPTPCEEVLWEDFDCNSVLPTPSQTADTFGWDSVSSMAPIDSANATPTPQAAVHPSSPASVMEISRDKFPPLETPTLTAATKPHTKPSKGKDKKAKPGMYHKVQVLSPPNDYTTAPTNDEDPFLAADIARATAASLSLTTLSDHVINSAFSLHRPEAAPRSPSKHLHANTSSDAAPTPFGITTATHTATPTNAAATSPANNGMLTTAPSAAASTTPSVVSGGATSTAANALAITTAATPAAMPLANANAAAAPVATIAIGAALLPLWLTADGLPLRSSYTPTPAGGFPTIVYSPELLLQGIPLDLIKMYDDIAQSKFFIVVSGGNRAVMPVMRTHGLIQEALGSFVNIDPTSFTLGTPPTATNGTSPALWLAANISPQLVQAIIDNHIISSTSITLFPLLYNMPIIGIVGSSWGSRSLTLTPVPMLRLIHSAIAGNNEITQFVQAHRDTFRPQVSAEQAWALFPGSITVHGIVLILNDTNTVAWRLYVDPSTNDRTSHDGGNAAASSANSQS